MVAQRGAVFPFLLCTLLFTELINGTNYMFTMGGYYWSSRNTCSKTCSALSATCVAFKIDNDNPLEETTVTTTLLQEMLFRILKWPCYNEGSPESTQAKMTKAYSPYIVRDNTQNCYGWNSNTVQTSCTTGVVGWGMRLCLCRKEDSFATRAGSELAQNISGCPIGFQQLQKQCLAPIPVKVTVNSLQTSYCEPIDAQILSFDDPKGYNFIANAGKKHFPGESIWAGGRIHNGYLVNYLTYQYADNSSYYGKFNGGIPPTNSHALLDTTAGDLSYTTGGNYAGFCARYPFMIFSKNEGTVRLEKGHRLLRTPVATLNGYTLNQCFSTCMGKMKIGCLSFNMHATSGVCELLAESADNWKSVLVNDADWYHFSIDFDAFPLN